jgi:hypothetical protein
MLVIRVSRSREGINRFVSITRREEKWLVIMPDFSSCVPIKCQCNQWCRWTGGSPVMSLRWPFLDVLVTMVHGDRDLVLWADGKLLKCSFPNFKTLQILQVQIQGVVHPLIWKKIDWKFGKLSKLTGYLMWNAQVPSLSQDPGWSPWICGLWKCVPIQKWPIWDCIGVLNIEVPSWQRCLC